MVGTYHELMVKRFSEGGKEVPQNTDAKGDVNKDKLIRELDCTVIEFMHTEVADQINNDVQERGFSEYKPFDSVRGVFTEGGPIFKGAGILEKTHVQICIRNLNCIKGFFLIRKEIDFLKGILRN
jgi:hypothetical protein